MVKNIFFCFQKISNLFSRRRNEVTVICTNVKKTGKSYENLSSNGWYLPKMGHQLYVQAMKAHGTKWQ